MTRTSTRRLRAAEALDCRSSSTRSSLTCTVRRAVADLVEEDRPVGELEAPGLAVARAGERALLVAEQLALEQRLGQRGAVDATIGRAAAGALLVDYVASSSLPVPVSPRISTVASVAATCFASATTPGDTAGLPPATFSRLTLSLESMRRKVPPR